MKIRLASDLHLEFEKDGAISTHTTIPRLDDDADTVLVLAGDITSNYRNMRKIPATDRYTPWIRDCINRFKAVIYVLGNHDLWGGGHWLDPYNYWANMAGNFPNFHMLQNEAVVIDGVRFLGTTLWTDLSNPMDQFAAMAMNDFKYIKVNRGNGRWTKWGIMDWNREHQVAIRFLEREVFETEWDGDTIVVTHHGPSEQSVGPEYKGAAINCCYYTTLERFMWYGNIRYWFHGHMHNSVRYKIGDNEGWTEVVTNPRGYVGEGLNPDYNPRLVLEV